ncbi:hypothetical protein OIE68_27660 [Nocardia vinacea]|uniref:Uncharacterized protein n=1 Tax=Nocardia vinacea TaxID=96468 RepID=A0ABZ1Z106_9NOCA|nr:hypothetical protein OIE68_27660 [Nocardia vinacea]
MSATDRAVGPMYDPTSDIDRIIAQQVGWSAADDHLLYTCGVIDFLLHDRLAELPTRATMVRTESDELCLAEGPAVWFQWRAVGDGTWNRNSVTAVGTLSFVAAAHLGNAMANRSRRRQAEAGLRPRWVAERPGSVMVSDRRMYCYNVDHSFSVHWAGLEMVDMPGSDRLICRYPDRNGNPHLLQVQSPWAVLIFALAAHTQFPSHPLLQSGNWLPAGFEEKCHIAGKTCPRVRHRAR